MAQVFGELGERHLVIGAAGFICGIFVPLALFLGYLFPSLSAGTQALVVATTLGAIGTLALAVATFFNVYQSTRSLKLKEKETTKPLARDELANVIEPAINTLEANLDEIRDSEHEGCALEWMYVDSSSWYGGGRKPDPIQPADSFAMGRLLHEDADLFKRLKKHNAIVEHIAGKAEQLQEQLAPEIEQQLAEYGLDSERNIRVVTQAVLQEIDEFGEQSELYDFWRDNRENLLTTARDRAENEIEYIQASEQEYAEFLEDTLEQLKKRKVELKHEYCISEDEIRVDESSFWESI